MVGYDAFEVAKQWLYRELGINADRPDIKKLNSLSSYLDEAYKLGYLVGYNEGWDSGWIDHDDNIRKVSDV
jgi:hypothetical protein